LGDFVLVGDLVKLPLGDFVLIASGVGDLVNLGIFVLLGSMVLLLGAFVTCRTFVFGSVVVVSIMMTL